MNKVTIDRELLEDLRDCANECYNHARMRGTSGLDNYERLTEQADAILAAAPQPVSDERDTLRPHAELLLVALETLVGACRNAEIFHGLTAHARLTIDGYRAAMGSKGE